jgi:predicted alternative tryptophan synthase beta-subunit
VTKFFVNQKIELIKWPAKSPDLNIMEDVWAQLTKQVYREGQFHKKSDLLAKILSEGPKIKKEFVQTLYDSIPKRLLDVYKLNGNMI